MIIDNYYQAFLLFRIVQAMSHLFPDPLQRAMGNKDHAIIALPNIIRSA